MRLTILNICNHLHREIYLAGGTAFVIKGFFGCRILAVFARVRFLAVTFSKLTRSNESR
jgi:hypothetical protein